MSDFGVCTLYIEPRSPWENGYIESFDTPFRDELVNGEIFFTLKEAQIVTEAWRKEYNETRLHSSLGYRTPSTVATLPDYEVKKIVS